MKLFFSLNGLVFNREMLYTFYADSLICPSCGHKRDCPANFMNISLELPATGGNPDEIENPDTPNDGSNKVRLTELFHEHMKPEVLDEDNKWECSGCNTKVQATKKLEYQKLPSSLMVHLKRIRFDQVRSMPNTEHESVSLNVLLVYIIS